MEVASLVNKKIVNATTVHFIELIRYVNLL